MEILNEYSGLFSLLAVVAAILIPCFIYRKEQKDKKKEMQNELDAMNECNRFPMNRDDSGYYTRKSFLEKMLKKK